MEGRWEVFKEKKWKRNEEGEGGIESKKKDETKEERDKNPLKE